MALSKKDNEEPLEFRWGLAGPRGINPLVRFYKSFTLDGTDYARYDCVYMYKEGAPLPYIGKLLKMWEHNEKSKKVKVQWFFQPYEISYYLKDEKVLKNELFFASGKGVGVVNVNPLEAIIGKCNVVCISKDSRNRRPSNEELRKADYVFGRTFNVDNLSISDKWEEHAGGLEVKFIFNQINDMSNNLGLPHGVVNDTNAVGCEVNRNLPIMASVEDSKSKCKEKFVSSRHTVSNVEKRLKQFEDSESRPANVEKRSKQSKDSESRPAKRMKPELGVNDLIETKKISLEGKAKIAPKDSFVHANDLHLDSMLNPIDVLSNKRNIDQDLAVNKPKFTSKLCNDSRSVAPSKSLMNLKSAATEKPKKLVVTPRPNVEKNTWFKEMRWEDQMVNAQEQGTLILLQNLDPEYTSGEVEDIIWHAFGEKCSAKMLQHTTSSSPHCGQVFVILRSKQVVDRVLKRLSEDCLMLPNGRPLVGELARLPKVSEKQASFAGHLSIYKLKNKMQKEMKDAVSTSHYSQRNTIEYEMAMHWFLLQARSTMWFNKLYKEQGDEMEKLKAKFQSRQPDN